MISVIVNGGTGEISLDGFVQSVTCSGDVQQAARRVEVTWMNTLDGQKRALEVAKGSEIRLLEDKVELFRGVIFGDRIDSKGNAGITAYDDNIYLTKSKDTKIFKGKKASEILSQLCKEYGIPVGTIADTGYVIPKLILRDKTLWEMFVTALTVTFRAVGRRFFMFSKGGKFQLSERKNVVAKWVLENGRNIIDASYTTSIEEMKTKVKVMGQTKDKKEIVAQVQDAALIQKYGIMQHLENASGDVTKSQIEQTAKQLLKQLAVITDDASLTCVGDNDVAAGCAVYVREQMTGIVGSYYVSTDSHTWDAGGVHTMSISLTATDDLPTMEYEAPNEPGDDKSKKAVKPKKATATDAVKRILNAKGTG